MPRRSLATLAFLVAVVLAAALLPRTPAGRGWILDRVQQAASSAGWTLTWNEAGGNPWRELELHEARLQGPGVDADLDRARVAWFAPALLTGDLPLWIEMDGGRIDLDVEAFEVPDGGAGGLPVQPEIRGIDLQNVEVTIDDAPYTLPDVRAEGLRVRGRSTGVQVGGRLVTPEGSLVFDARVATSPLRIEAGLSDVDARLGRSWWEGVTGGTAEGTAAWNENEGLRLDLRIRDGAITAGGVDVSDIVGDARLRSGLVTADLSGAALDGPVAATGRVDVANRQWSASLRATPRLDEAARRFAPDALPNDLRPRGEALVTARASGWTHVEIDGRIVADGTLNGRPLTMRGDDLRYVLGEGLDVTLEGEALGGRARLSTGGDAPGGWRLELADASYGPAEEIGGEATFRPGGEPLLSFLASGTVGEQADLTVDGTLSGDEASAFVSGTLRPDGEVTGAVAWSEGEVTGAVRVTEWTPPGQPPLSAELEFDGPPTELPLTLRVLGEQPWTPRLGPAEVDADLRGTVRGVLEDGEVRRLDGALGPLTLSGTVRPAATDGRATADLSLALAPTRVTLESSATRAVASLENGALRLPGEQPGDRARLQGDLRLDEVEVPSAELAPIEGRLDLRLVTGAGAADAEDAADAGAARTDAALVGTFEGSAVRAELAGGVLELEVDGHPVTVADVAGSSSASLVVPLNDPLQGLRGSAALQAGEANVQLEATDASLRAEAVLPAGAELAGRPLQEPLTVNVDLPDRSSGDLSARLGSVRLTGTVDVAAAVPFEGTLRTGEEALQLRVLREPWRIEADGEAHLDALADALDLPGAGRLQAEGFAYGPGGASGAARLTLEEPLRGTVRWREGEVDGTLPTPVGEVSLAGTVRAGEEPVLTASHPWGRLIWTEAGVEGGGTIPARSWNGIELEATPWTLGSLESGATEPASLGSPGGAAGLLDDLLENLELRAGGSSARWRDGAVRAELDLPARVAGEPARLTGTVTSENGDLAVDLSAAGPGGSVATVRGRPAELAVTLDAPAEALAEAAAAPVELRGSVSVSATVDLLDPAVDGVGSWRAGEEELDLTVTGPPWTAVARGPDVEVTWTPGTVQIRADEATVGAFAPALAGVTLSGELARDAGELAEDGADLLSDWRGDLAVGAPELGSVRLRGEGTNLTAEGALTWQGVDLDVRGSVLPDVDVAISARHEPSGLEADVDAVLGEGGTPQFDGVVRWPSLDVGPAEVEAGQARLQGTPSSLRLLGEGDDVVTFEDGELAGAWTLPVRVNDLPHRLHVEPSGTQADPSAIAQLSGPVVEGTATLGGGEGEPLARVQAQVRPEAWPDGLEAAQLGAAQLEAEVARSGAWTATVDAAASPDDRTFGVHIEAEGSGSEGMARWTVTDAAGDVPVLAGGADFGREGVVVRADLDTLNVAAVADAFGLEAAGDAGGRLSLTWQPDREPAFAFAGEAGLSGTVAGVPLEAEAERSGDEERVRLRSGDLEIVADRRGGAGDWSLLVAGDQLSLTGSVAGDLQLAELAGTVRGEPSTLRVARDPGGPLLAVASYSGASATVAVRTAEEGLRASVDASLPSGAGLPVAGSASATALWTGGELLLERADVALAEPRSLRAELRGPLWPAADLRGVAEGVLPAAGADAPPEPLALTVRGTPAELEVRASLAGLTLDALLHDGEPQRLALSGAGGELFGVQLVPGGASSGSEALAWTAQRGWSGSAVVRVDAERLELLEEVGLTRDGAAEEQPLLRAELRGTPEGLTATIRGVVEAVGATATAELRAQASGAPWDATLTGDGRVDLLFAAAGETIRLDMPVRLAGTPLRPVLTGEPELSGTVEAAGTLRADRGGATLALEGPTLRLDAAAGPGGWNVDGRVVDLPLEPWIAQLDEPRLAQLPLEEPRLDAEVRASAAWGEAPEDVAGDWTLRARGGSASGTARLGAGVSVTANVDADLAALSDGEASGILRGPLSLHAAPGEPLGQAEVSGALRADGVRVADLSVEGELALDGRLPVPGVVADLRLAGPVEGPLRLSWRPEGDRLELVADVTAAGVHADVRLAGGPNDLQASGTITAPSGALDLSAMDGAVVLRGRGGWEGIEGRLRPFSTGGEVATLRAPLGRLAAAALPAEAAAAAPPVSGVLDVAVDPYAEDWLRGTAQGAELAGVALPDLDLEARGGTVYARGGGEAGEVEASLDVPALTWRLAVGDLAVAPDVTVSGEGSGERDTGNAEFVLRERSGGAGASEVRAYLERRRDGFRITADGTLRGADLAVDLRREDGVWQGPVEIAGLATPAGRLSLSGQAAGEGPWPHAAVSTRLEGPVDASGTITTAPDAVSVDLDVELPGGDTATVQGRIWPSVVLAVRGAEDQQFRLAADAWNGAGPWTASGATTLSLAGVEVMLDAQPDTSAPRLTLMPDALEGGRLVADLPSLPPLPAIGRILEEGLLLRGEGDLAGRARWLPPAGFIANELTWRGSWGSLRLDGEVRDGSTDLTGILTRAGEEDADAPPLLPGLLSAPFGAGPVALRLQGGLEAARLEVEPTTLGADASGAGGERSGHAAATWSGPDRTVTIDVDTEALALRAELRPGEGLTGEAQLRGLPLQLPGLPTAQLDGTLTASGATLHGEAQLRGPGRITLDGSTDLTTWLPDPYRPSDRPDAASVADATSLSLRVVDLNPATFPWLTERLPGLTGGLSAVVEVRGSRVLAQVTAPELRTGGRELPLRLEGAGELSGGGSMSFGGSWAGSGIQGSIDADAVELLWRLEGFPLQAPIEARVGPLDVDVEATGVARVRLPFDGSEPPDVRLATERVRLERGDIVTHGTLSIELREGGLDLDADFRGDGRWAASGTIRPNDLDFTFEAEDADATPLLGLVPALAPLGAGASGDLTVHASGSFDDPEIVMRTDDLELALAGSRYRLTDSEAVLRGAELRVQGALEGVEPVGGRIVLGGEGRLLLAPWRLEDAAISLEGELNLPVVGNVSDVSGLIRADPEGRPRLDLDARMGAPLRVEGTLWPLDLIVRGQGLQLQAPTLLLASSTSDVDLHLSYDDRFRLSGSVAAREGRFALGIRPRSEPEADRAPNQALSRFVLEDITVTGRRLSFNENFGSAEFDAELRIGGTAAAPRVSGTATAQRGTFRFSGREFDLVRAVAEFEPSRGAYPTLDVEAVTRFEKREVLGSAAAGVSFEAPSGSTFEVRLAFDAEVLPTPGEARPFRLDLDPVLTSDAVVNVPANEGLTAGARSLTEAELVSLVALGRLDLSGELAGSSGVAGGVAQSALDSAVDLLILSELQSALSEALGLDLVEIRTSTLSSVLDGGDDPFGVSLRLGGYLNEALFASVEVSRFGETSRELALTNTLNLTYELGPVEFELQTRLGFPRDADLTPVPELSAGLRYQITPFVAIETGASVSTPESEARFGVTLSW